MDKLQNNKTPKLSLIPKLKKIEKLDKTDQNLNLALTGMSN